MTMVYRLSGGDVLALEHDTPFPPAHHALQDPSGLIAIGDTLHPERLLDAYHQGIFPWYSAGQPVLWWTPDPRMVLFPAELKVSHSLEKRMRRKDYQVRFDTSFRAVMQACATAPRPDQDGTWITPDIIDAYCRLHETGYAHSVETWMDGQLVGGLYGVSLGKLFYGESMFHHAADASKIAFVTLVRHLQQQGFGMIDCQMHTQHLARFGGREIPRSEFLDRLTALIQTPVPEHCWP
jgi:leucyl/phenylalanyl-tRNA--protein transferase